MYKKSKNVLLLMLSVLLLASCDLNDSYKECAPGTVGCLIEIPTDFTASNVYSVYDGSNKKIAEICHEYIKGYSDTKTATVLYSVDASGQRTNKGIVCDNQASVVWATDGTNTCTYTAATKPALTKVWYDEDTKEFIFDPVKTNKPTTQEAETVTDVEGNVYPVVKVGLQYWTRESLKTRKYNDAGTLKNIPTNFDKMDWAFATGPACAIYMYDNAFVVDTEAQATMNKYGLLYNWYVLDEGMLDIAGWEIPAKTDFQDLVDYVEYAGRFMSPDPADWRQTVTAMNNVTNMTLVGSGFRAPIIDYMDISEKGSFCTLYARDLNVIKTTCFRVVIEDANKAPSIKDTYSGDGRVDGFSVRLMTKTLPARP